MCLLLNLKIVHCELYVFSFSFVHTAVCANCKEILVIIYYSKKKKKKEKNDPYFGMGKITKVMSQKAPLSIFFLGKGGESLHLQLYLKN